MIFVQYKNTIERFVAMQNSVFWQVMAAIFLGSPTPLISFGDNTVYLYEYYEYMNARC